VERGREPLKGYWSLPGGLVETGERLEAAVVREIFEETALRIQPTALFEIFERIMPDAFGRAEYHYVLVVKWWVGRCARETTSAAPNGCAVRSSANTGSPKAPWK
jgi:ADP-ribose pyrophosphatase YjhB (NUDIX family)